MDERQHLLQEIHQYEHDIKVQSERIKELESAMQKFVEDFEEAQGKMKVHFAYNAVDKIKQLLEKG